MAGSIGEQLKQARAGRSISLEKVAQVTHIRLKYLEALETDQWNVLPSEVQGRGFLRLYADFLGLPVQPLLDIRMGKTSPVIVPVNTATQPEPEIEEIPQSQQQSSPSPETSQSYNPESIQETILAAQRIFIEIGNQLRKRRISLGLSLDDIERYIHIKSHYLHQLEEGKIENLPSPVQGRGMLHNYASFLNLDRDAILLRFAEGLQQQRLEKLPAPSLGFSAKKQSAAAHQPGWRKFITADLLLVGGLIVGLLIVGIWGASRVSAARSRSGMATPPSVSEILLYTTTPTMAGTGNTAGTSVPGAATQVGKIANTATPFPTLMLPTIEGAPLQVYVVARQSTYLRVIVDQKRAFDGRVTPGTAYPFSGKDRIELLTGSGAALQVLFNQRDLGTLGLVGQVVGLVFTKEGVRTPTPAATLTPSRTVPPTLTRQPTATQPTATITPFIP